MQEEQQAYRKAAQHNHDQAILAAGLVVVPAQARAAARTTDADDEHVTDHGDGRAGDVILVSLVEVKAFDRVLQHGRVPLAVLEFLVAVDEAGGL